MTTSSNADNNNMNLFPNYFMTYSYNVLLLSSIYSVALNTHSLTLTLSPIKFAIRNPQVRPTLLVHGTRFDKVANLRGTIYLLSTTLLLGTYRGFELILFSERARHARFLYLNNQKYKGGTNLNFDNNRYSTINLDQACVDVVQNTCYIRIIWRKLHNIPEMSKTTRSMIQVLFYLLNHQIKMCMQKKCIKDFMLGTYKDSILLVSWNMHIRNCVKIYFQVLGRPLFSKHARYKLSVDALAIGPISSYNP
ncbi:hypothetical protein AGLY_018292 [Aphis glycines]|uniref:Uncharacterized protein n=1 Tax=Aphis glycines TaxID=307491 RepID=A0A6G0SSR9_APHGL|nr:hypothetical protein AGLY_018292 [Aphis glycines]